MNYEDVEQGADHDMDAIAKYTYTVNGDGTVSVTTSSSTPPAASSHGLRVSGDS